MRGPRKLVAVVVVALVVAAGLSGCISNQPAAAVPWLRGQDGIVGTSVSTSSEELLVTGTVRGELDPKLSDAKLRRLIEKVADYGDAHSNVTFELGRHGLDFVVRSDHAVVDRELTLWRAALKVPKIVNGLVDDRDLTIATLRPDAVKVLTSLGRLDADLEVDAYADTKTLNDFDSPIAFRRPRDCTPRDDVVRFAEDLPSRELRSATVDFCTSIEIDLAPKDSVAAVAPALRAELEQRGLADFPVTIESQTDPDDASDLHQAAVTPGNAGALAVLAQLEKPGAPTVAYDLDADRALTVNAFQTPVADLLGLFDGPPVPGVASVSLAGDTARVYGPLSDLQDLLQQADALIAASTAYGDVELGVDTGSVSISGDNANHPPDMHKTATDLRASGATLGRTFTVVWGGYHAIIVNGGPATLADPDYTDPHVIQSFADAWNAGG